MAGNDRIRILRQPGRLPAVLVGAVTVPAPGPREAAARAYVRLVGRGRARFTHEQRRDRQADQDAQKHSADRPPPRTVRSGW